MDKTAPETMTPEEYLGYLQQASIGGYERLKHFISSVSQRDSRESMENWINSASITESEKEILRKRLLEPYHTIVNSPDYSPPTQFERGGFHIMLESMRHGIEETAKELGLRIPEKVIVGTLFTRQVNAAAIKVPSGGTLIVVNQGTFMFIHLFAKIVASLFPVVEDSKGRITFSTRIEDIEKEIDSNKEANERFVETLFSYLILGDPYRARQYFQFGPPKLIADTLRNVAELFIVAHEYAHLILNHHEGSNLISYLVGDVEARQFSRSQQNESEADAMGLWLTLNTNKQLGLQNAYVGIDFFFSLIDLIEKVLGIKPNDSHEPTELRQLALRLWLQMLQGQDRILLHGHDILSDVPPGTALSAINLSNIVRHIINSLWEKNKVVFYNAVYQFGVTPTISLY